MAYCGRFSCFNFFLIQVFHAVASLAVTPVGCILNYRPLGHEERRTCAGEREKKCCQGTCGKPGQTTVAPIKAWRGSPAEPLQPLTAPRDKTSGAGCAIHFYPQPAAGAVLATKVMLPIIPAWRGDSEITFPCEETPLDAKDFPKLATG